MSYLHGRLPQRFPARWQSATWQGGALEKAERSTISKKAYFSFSQHLKEREKKKEKQKLHLNELGLRKVGRTS